ncbi:MAG TPA: FAD-dependent oxidoreductase [Ornithinimicrobium sp.]|nr:FAD-dependent oxidoreductase [Ornithinimicrobium sp.]
MSVRHEVVVVGGGNGGISLAGRLRRLGCQDVVLIDPGPVHRYRPLLNYVAGGQAEMSGLTRPMQDVVPDGCTWLPGRVVAVHAGEHEVELSTGERVGYVDLVLAPGLEPDLEGTPGLAEAMDQGWSTTAHLSEQAEAVWEVVRRTRRGRVVFTVPPEPSPCGGTALKPLFLACDHWRELGVLSDVEVHLVTPYASVLDLPFVEQQLRSELDRFGVTVHHRATVAGVDPSDRSVTLETSEGPEVLRDVEHAFVVPHYRAPGWVAPLAGTDPAGLIDVDPGTLAHRRVPWVWALGDAAAVGTRPSGGALRRQVEVLADNILRSRTGRGLRTYDGYTIVPVTVDRRRLLLAEFDRTGTPRPTVRRPDLTRPSRALWAFDRYVEPVVYFRALLRGRV